MNEFIMIVQTKDPLLINLYKKNSQKHDSDILKTKKGRDVRLV